MCDGRWRGWVRALTTPANARAAMGIQRCLPEGRSYRYGNVTDREFRAAPGSDQRTRRARRSAGRDRQGRRGVPRSGSRDSVARPAGASRRQDNSTRSGLEGWPWVWAPDWLRSPGAGARRLGGKRPSNGVGGQLGQSGGRRCRCGFGPGDATGSGGSCGAGLVGAGRW